MGQKASDARIKRELLLIREKKGHWSVCGYPRRQWFNAWHSPPKLALTPDTDDLLKTKK